MSYTAPASKVFTVAHIPAEAQPDDDGEEASAVTRCGLPIVPDELWVPVELRSGDEICRGCQGIDDEQGAMW